MASSPTKTKKCASEIVPRPGRFGLQRSSRRFLSLQNIPLETLGPSNGARLSRGGRGERGRFRRTFIHSRHNGISSRGRMRGRGARRRDANAARSRDRLHPVLYLARRSKKGVFEKAFLLFVRLVWMMLLVLQTHTKQRRKTLTPLYLNTLRSAVFFSCFFSRVGILDAFFFFLKILCISSL